MAANITPAKRQLSIGAWATHKSRNNPNAPERKVTVVGYDDHGYVLFAEGWLDIRATDADNITVGN